MNERAEVVVIGAGLIGAACARALARAGADVALVERADARGAAWIASAGMLAAQVESDAGDPLLPLAIAGREWFANNVPMLQHESKIDVDWLESGIVEVVGVGADATPLQRRAASQRRDGLRAEWLAPADVAARWPWLAPTGGGFWSPDDGAVDPTRLVDALREDARRHGARFIVDDAIGIARDQHGVTGVRCRSRQVAASHVVIAAGAWSAALAGLPRAIPVKPMRGQMIAFPWPAGEAPAIAYGAGCYLVHRRGEMLVGATVESTGFDATLTPDAARTLHDAASTLYPPLRTITPTRQWAGLRPWSADGLPIIGGDLDLSGLWYATGHGRNGVLLSGVTGDLIAALLDGRPPSVDLMPFGSERFARR